MFLGITHKSNKTALDILSYLETKGNIINCREVRIEESVYLNILVKCGFSNQKYIVNSAKAISKSLNSHYVEQILYVNGITYNESPDESVSRTYEVLVYERSAISIKQRIHGKISSPYKYVEEDQCKKIVELAKRVIYLLCLDYGMVKISVTGRTTNIVTSINTSPRIRDKDFTSLLRKLDRVIAFNNDSTLKEVKMGADPEFMISNSRNGKMIPASQFFPRDGVVGCDNIRMPNRQNRPIAELRPKPDYSPRQLLLNIKEALRMASKLTPYKNVKLLAGSRPFIGYSIGGHIHFSNVDINNHILRALDSYVGLPIFLIENQVTAVKRRNRYGFLADIRVKDYGGFEYRTPGSWLVSPEIASAVLCLAKIVASNYLKLTRNCFITVEAQRAFYEGNQEYLRLLFDDVWSDIRKTEMYNDFKEELQIINDMVNKGAIWNENEDIRKTWDINIQSKKYAASNTSVNQNYNENPDPVNNAGSSRGRNQTRRAAMTSTHNNTLRSSPTGNSSRNNNRGRRSSRSNRVATFGPVN